MISLKQTNQGGSVTSFVIIAALLVFGVVGTAYFVQQRGEQVRTEQAIAQADKRAEQEKKDTPSETKTDSDESDGKEVIDTPTAVPTTPTPAPSPAETPGTQTPVALPSTGPASDLTQILIIGLLAASGVGYVMSRRALSRSL